MIDLLHFCTYGINSVSIASHNMISQRNSIVCHEPQILNVKSTYSGSCMKIMAAYLIVSLTHHPAALLAVSQTISYVSSCFTGVTRWCLQAALWEVLAKQCLHSDTRIQTPSILLSKGHCLGQSWPVVIWNRSDLHTGTEHTKSLLLTLYQPSNKADIMDDHTVASSGQPCCSLLPSSSHTVRL